MQHFRKILVGVDFSRGDRLCSPDLSPPTAEAIRRAIWLGQHCSSELTFFFTLDVSPQTEDRIRAATEAREHTVLDDAQRCLDDLVEKARAESVSAVRKVVFGHPWLQLTREAVREGHDLVIVGTRRHSAASRILFGTTALRLLRNCPCPVWVTKPDPNWDEMNILVASDFSEASQRAMEIAVGGGQLVDTRLHVLHAIEEDVDRRLQRSGLSKEQVAAQHHEVIEEMRRKLQGQLAQTDYRTVSGGVKVHVVEGPADVMILKAIEEHKIDHLVMGTGTHGHLTTMLLGDTAERLLPHVPCSLIAIKPEGFKSPVTA